MDKALRILENTNDGENLSPRHLRLVQNVVNGYADRKALKEFERVYQMTLSGNYVDWFHGIEHMTQDHEGYILWKGERIEHFSYSDKAEEKEVALQLAKGCRVCERKGKNINFWNVIVEVARI